MSLLAGLKEGTERESVTAITLWSNRKALRRVVKLQSPLPNSICLRMLQRALPAGVIAPCLPTKTDKLPSGGQSLHEIKHDGFRIIARKDGPRVRLESIFLYAFDLIELNGDDLRKSTRPRSRLSWPRPAPASGSTVSRATARPSSPTPASLVLEGIVSKRKDSAARPIGSK